MEIRKLLRESALRCTPAREAVLRVLYDARRPLAHGQIAAAPGMEDVDRVTLYRTLTALEEAGLLHRVQDREGVWHFCAHPPSEDGCPGDHPHFVCDTCGQIRCLNGQSLPWIAVEEGERVSSKQLVAYGTCAACSIKVPGSRMG